MREAVGRWPAPKVGYRRAVQGGDFDLRSAEGGPASSQGSGHQFTPKKAAALAPARQPSSWKPHPW